MTDLKYHVAISKTNKIGPRNFQFLRNFFPDLKTVWQASVADFVRAGLTEKTAQEFCLKKREIDPDQEMANLEKENVSVIPVDDGNYPALLKEIFNPPHLLYYRGSLLNLNKPTIAVVGTRKMSSYGKQVVMELVEKLVEHNFIVVSGLALGIDAQAHLAAVKNKRTTIAVLGSGLDSANIYPITNRSLAQEIINNKGIIFSEYPLGTMPLKHNFPARNRIISGLSKATLVIEAGESSGALITAKFALEQNRDVFAIPGPINQPGSCGTNDLIKQGAKAITCVEDILEEFNIQEISTLQIQEEYIPESPEEATILKFLSQEPQHINELVKLSNLSVTEVNAKLIMLEMKGQVKNLGGMTYVRNI